MKNRPFHVRLGFALAGIRHVWRQERSFRTQCAVAGVGTLVLLVIRPGARWTAIFALAIALVLALEILNSALEYLIDHLHPTIAPEIGRAKDAAAGAVLVASIAAVLVAASMLIDRVP